MNDLATYNFDVNRQMEQVTSKSTVNKSAFGV
jgi:hypothetical protein